MISGALLLAPSHRNTISGFLKKRLLKIVPSYLAWALIYFAWRIYIEEEDLTWTVFPGELAAGSVYYHLWFLNMLLELYLLVPFLRILVEFTPKAVLIYGLGLWLIWFSFVPTLQHIFGLEVYSSYAGYIGYFILGHQLSNVRLKGQGLVLASISWALAASLVGFFSIVPPSHKGGFYRRRLGTKI